jgi:hypothetical protein
MTDIVERLRAVRFSPEATVSDLLAIGNLTLEAADEIDRLRADVAGYKAERADWKKACEDHAAFCDIKDDEIERLRTALESHSLYGRRPAFDRKACT